MQRATLTALAAFCVVFLSMGYAHAEDNFRLVPDLKLKIETVYAEPMPKPPVVRFPRATDLKMYVNTVSSGIRLLRTIELSDATGSFALIKLKPGLSSAHVGIDVKF